MMHELHQGAGGPMPDGVLAYGHRQQGGENKRGRGRGRLGPAKPIRMGMKPSEEEQEEDEEDDWGRSCEIKLLPCGNQKARVFRRGLERAVEVRLCRRLLR